MPRSSRRRNSATVVISRSAITGARTLYHQHLRFIESRFVSSCTVLSFLSREFPTELAADETTTTPQDRFSPRGSGDAKSEKPLSGLMRLAGRASRLLGG